jgi:ABC-type nitrate/sulfonate/bicarbonate transport system, permease component
MSDLVLPRPSQVFVTLFEKFPILWPHILQTLATTMIGFVLGVGLGVVLGAVHRRSKTAYDTAYPLLVGSLDPERSPWCRSSCCGSAPARCRRC